MSKSNNTQFNKMQKRNHCSISKITLFSKSFHLKNLSNKIDYFFQIGWRPFGADNLKRPSICLRIINIVYPICVFLLLLFNYTYETIVCQGKLNVKTDTQVSFSFFLLIILIIF